MILEIIGSFMTIMAALAPAIMKAIESRTVKVDEKKLAERRQEIDHVMASHDPVSESRVLQALADKLQARRSTTGRNDPR